ncbi:hypothetical protein F53441_1239 [Fusarium austroafricanum]|uniref:Uncharacterized protein n=1 Tax=Fusarium austroafricanum TaxID=2364996 RepID=A0A8H4KVW7_9HYPO|nr:hypothetical protein F53441_1239 [Fusarium austroafricanum]
MPKKKRPGWKKRWAEKAGPLVAQREEREVQQDIDAKEIADDDSLDFATKIDRLARVRNWFSADTTVVDKYMAGELSVSEAVETLAKPVDQAYSTANFGRQYFNAEQTARNQRQFHSPEKALEMWGPEQDFPEPEQKDDQGSAEMFLWDLWFSILHAAKRIPYTDEAGHEKLVDLVREFKARPDPPAPEPMTIPLKREWIWESGALWSELSVLGISIAEVSNDVCGCGAGWLWPEQRANENLCAFQARLLSYGISDLTIGSHSTVPLEEAPFAGYHARERPFPLEILSHNVTRAALWTIIAGKKVYAWYPHTRDERDIEVVDRIIDQRGKELPWNRSRRKYRGRARWETARREFARRRFVVESENEQLSDEVRELAAKAAKVMEDVVWDKGSSSQTDENDTVEESSET